MPHRVLAFDPGLTNFAVWLGSASTDAQGRTVPVTHRIEKFDLKKEGKKATYEAVADTILACPWMTEPDIEAVVETQAMQNIPARIVATTIYGVLRGQGVPVCFSGAKLKNDAMDVLSQQYGVKMEPKPDKETKGRIKIMHAVNKRNSKLLVSQILRDIGDVHTQEFVAGAKDPSGKSKSDDLTDAILLGIGQLICKTTSRKKCSRQQHKV